VGRIGFFSEGEGWFHASEVLAARAYQTRFGGTLEILEGYTLAGGAPARPFAFVADLYATRAEWKRQRRPAEVVLKLSLNSLYGASAQQLGGTAERPPPYFEPLWAGAITAQTRARLVLAALGNPDAIAMFATDGLFSTEPLGCYNDGERGLGSWEGEEFTGLAIAQAGVYWVRQQDGSWYHKSRGFDKAALATPERILDAWRARKGYRGPCTITTPSSRFVTLGSALASEDQWGRWRSWVTDDRLLDISGISHKRGQSDRERFTPHRRLMPLAVNDNAYYLEPGSRSHHYALAWASPSDEARDRVLDYEHEEGEL
jgi:hypothetical protein